MTLVPETEEPKFFMQATSDNDPIGMLRIKLLTATLEHAKEHKMQDTDVLAVLGNICGTIRFYAEGAGMTLEDFNQVLFLNVDSAYAGMVEQDRLAQQSTEKGLRKITKRMRLALKRNK